MHRITLALVTYNQAEYLQIFLRNYHANSKHATGPIPLIVVDDGSTDSTLDILNAQSSFEHIHVVRSEHISIAHARNLALESCRTEWLAFSDTDCVLPAAYFRRLYSIPSEYGSEGAVEGRILAPQGTKPPFTHSLINSHGGMYATANMVFRVSVVLELGGFDEKFRNYREDADLALRIRRKVGTIPFCPNLEVIHPHVPRTLRQVFKTAYRSQKNIIGSEIRLWQNHPAAYGSMRARADCRSTLWAWCLLHSLWAWKESLPEWNTVMKSEKFPVDIRELAPRVKLIIAALFEHVCIVLACMHEWKSIRDLRIR